LSFDDLTNFELKCFSCGSQDADYFCKILLVTVQQL